MRGARSGRKLLRLPLRRNGVPGTASLFAFLLVSSLTGCSSSIKKGEVSGVITQGDEPLDSVMVYFMPDPEQQTAGNASWAITDEEGRYVLEYQGEEGGSGAAVGWHRVTIEDLVPENFRGRGAPPRPRVTPAMMDPSKTPFRYEVVEGEQTIDIDVNDPPQPGDGAGGMAAD